MEKEIKRLKTENKKIREYLEYVEKENDILKYDGINKQIENLQKWNKDIGIKLMVHWNGFEIIEFHTIKSLMDKYSDITPDRDISYLSLTRRTQKVFDTYDHLFKEILIGEEVEIHNMTIVRII